ncbi:DNA-3-methyladenine glycosylase family protein [Paenibacillus guangzhouensis]|uniref:DNA-3-methyladenine glycosylase family protein n=1 Tax=Paenibacillus guangzhouensis TaxID=1473112 RepID=UPI0012671A9F|nr:DNA-3-methyladenine glycosylase [Paenibacillus guangzhouensis]
MVAVYTKYFDYGQKEMDELTRKDAVLGAAITRLGKVERIVMPDVFTALIHAIIGQLISAKAAHVLWERMQARFEEMTPTHLSRQTAEEIQKCGITMKKAVTIHQISQSIAAGAYRLDDLHALPDEDVIRRLTMLKGVGRWTADMILIHALERPDVISWGDVAIRRGMMKLYGLPTLTQDQFEQYRLKYSPLGSVASIYLWAISSESNKVL